QWLPEGAAFYGALLRNREQCEAALKSRAWAKVKSLPFVQALCKRAQAELTGEQGKLAPLYKLAQDPENKKLIGLLGDMVSDEVFVYGGDKWPAFVELAQQFQGLNLRVQTLLVSRLMDRRRLNPAQLQALVVLHILEQNLDK